MPVIDTVKMLHLKYSRKNGMHVSNRSNILLNYLLVSKTFKSNGLSNFWASLQQWEANTFYRKDRVDFNFVCKTTLTINLLNFLNGINSNSHFWNCPFSFYEYQDENWKLVSQQNRGWSDCKEAQAVLALYWWQKPITLGSCRTYGLTTLWCLAVNDINTSIESQLCYFDDRWSKITSVK